MRPTFYTLSFPRFQATRGVGVFSTALLLACGLPGITKAAESWMLSTPEPLPSPINLSNTFQARPACQPTGGRSISPPTGPGATGNGISGWRNGVRLTASGANPVNLGPEVNTAAAEVMPTISADGLTLYFGDGNPFGWGAAQWHGEQLPNLDDHPGHRAKSVGSARRTGTAGGQRVH